MEKDERKELEQEYENLKLLAAFHDSYGIPENEREREELINDLSSTYKCNFLGADNKQ